MADGFKIASAYAEVKGEVNEGSVRTAGRKAGNMAADEADKVGESRKGSFLKTLFTPNPGMFAALRAPFAAALSTPIAGAGIAVAGVFAASFVGAMVAAFATAGLGAAFLAVGASALLGGKADRDKARADLDKAKADVAKAQAQANSGSAASQRHLADATAALAKAQAVVNGGKAFAELDTSLSRLGSTLKTVGVSAAMPLMKPLADAFASLDRSAKSLQPVLSGIFADLAPAIGPLTDGISGFVTEFLKALTADPATMQSVKDALVEIAKHLPGLGKTFGELFATLAGNEDNIKNIGVAFSILGNTLKVTGAVLSFWAAGLQFWVGVWHTVQDAVMAAVNWITQTAWPAIQGFFSGIGQWFADLPGKISAAFASVKQWFSDLKTSIGEWFTSVGLWFSELPGKIGAFLAGLPGQLGSLFGKALDAALFAIGFGIGLVFKFFMEAPGKIGSFLASIPGKLGTLFTTAWNTAKNAVSTGVTATLKFFSDLPGKASSALSSLWSKMSGAFSTAVTNVKTKAGDMVDGAIKIIKDLPSKIATALATVKDKVTGAFKGAADWLKSAGKDLISGIKNGIADAIEGAVGAAKNAAKRIVDGFKSALKIGSPSKVMADEVGRWIPEGIGVGIEKNMGAAQKPMADTTAALTQPMRAGMGAGASGSAGGATYHFAPGSIVLDASKIKDIQDLLNMINGIQSTTRQFGGQPVALAGTGVRF